MGTKLGEWRSEVDLGGDGVEERRRSKYDVGNSQERIRMRKNDTQQQEKKDLETQLGHRTVGTQLSGGVAQSLSASSHAPTH